MVLAPLAHALDVEGATQVMLVFLLHEPLPLARRHTCLSAFGLFAILLVPGIAGIWSEGALTVLAVALSDSFCH